MQGHRKRRRRGGPIAGAPADIAKHPAPAPCASNSVIPAATLLHSCRSAHHDIFVYERGTTRYLTFEGQASAPDQTAIDANDPRRLVGQYRHALVAAVAIHGAPKRVLCLGVGGGAVPMAIREAFPSTTVDAVDIDADVIRIARSWFGLAGDEDALNLHTADARSFLRRACAKGDRWDVILQDVFDRHYVPAHLMTVEYYREMNAVLEEGGVAAINSFAQGELYERELATYAAVLGKLLEVSADEGSRVLLAHPATSWNGMNAGRNLQLHADALLRVGTCSATTVRQLRAARCVTTARLLTDGDLKCPKLAASRRVAVQHAVDMTRRHRPNGAQRG